MLLNPLRDGGGDGAEGTLPGSQATSSLLIFQMTVRTQSSVRKGNMNYFVCSKEFIGS